MEGKTDRELLEEIHEMLSQNNKTLHKIHTRGRLASILGMFKWVIYIGLIAGTYYFIQNNLGNVFNLYTGIQENNSSLDVKSMLDLLGR